MVSGFAQSQQNVSGNLPSRPLSEIIGSTHTRPNYYFGKQDCLNEGADRLLALGTKVVKVFFYMGKETPDKMYPWNSEWPTVKTHSEGAQLPYWKIFFDKPFKTFIITTLEIVPEKEYYWRENFTAEQEQEVERQMYEFARYLLQTYKGTGKTFIISNHETDWHLEGQMGDWDVEAPDAVYANAVRWFNARQRGVQRARQEAGTEGVLVLHSGEVVHVVKSMQTGQKNMVNKVLPYAAFDLISYSAWDATVVGGIHPPQLLKDALDYIAKNAQPSVYYGHKKHIYIGEFGIPENEYTAEQIQTLVSQVVEIALEWGCPYIVYWQLYCNEPQKNVALPSWNLKDHRGFWLIRSDNTYTPVYDYFHQLFKTDQIPSREKQ